jgi:hypothetical protein
MSQIENKYRVKDNKLIVGDCLILFDFPIKDVVEISEMLIVRVESPMGKIYNENVFGVSLSEKKIKWQIEKRSKKYPGLAKDCPFIEVFVSENKLRLNNWCSHYLIVDPLTRKVLGEGETR